MTATALSHLRVIDLTHYFAGPYCTKLLAGFGADVVKIERPGGGDPLRGVGPFVRGEHGLETSVPFLWLNTGKKSATLDLKTAEGADILKRLVREADVLVESFSPRVLPSLGLDYGTLAKINPGLVMTSISSFGQTGPYRDYRAESITTYALSGGMSLTGDPARAPLGSGANVAEYSAGMHAYIGTLMAVFARAAGGAGQHVDVSVQESAIDNIEIALTEHLQLDKNPKRTNDHHSMVPWELYDCADGAVAAIGGPARHWLRAAELFEEPRLFDDAYRTPIDRIEHRSTFEPLLRPWLGRHRKKETFHAAQERGLAFGYLADPDDVLHHNPHLRERGFFVPMEHPVAGAYETCGAPFRLTATPWKNARAPLLGEHSELVYGGLGHSAGDVEQLRRRGIV
jgi:crotonobetainyl-CoA:carnitine CoA-transferase CaiB-like acyl-CoA transferase